MLESKIQSLTENAESYHAQVRLNTENVEENRRKLVSRLIAEGFSEDQARIKAKNTSAALVARRLQQYELNKRSLEHPKIEFSNSVKSFLENQGNKLQCLDLRTQTQLFCWGAAYIIDPTMVAGAALKG